MYDLPVTRHATAEPCSSGASVRVVMSVGWLLALTLIGGCNEELLLVVDLRTDFQPGLEFSAVRTEVIRPADTPGGLETRRSAETPASASDDFVSGQRVGEFLLSAVGDRIVRTSLLDSSGAVVIARDTRVNITESLGLTVLITRSCRGVMCPGATDDARATQCLGGSCVRPECSVENPAACGNVECGTDTECAPSVECVDGRCSGGYCLQVPQPGRCAPSDFCDVARGCVEIPTGVDGGLDGGVGGDAGPCVPEAEICNERDDNCDGTVDEGFDLTSDVDHCGSCGTVCGGANATPSCVSGVCALACDVGWADCNGDVSDGCEASLASGATCGTCATACVEPTPLCVLSGVDYACASTCPPDSPTLCDASCVDLDTSLAHCGGCGVPCAPADATASCAGGTCAIATCDAGRADCNGDVADGCETDLSSSTSCGDCGVTCGAAAPYCVSSGGRWSCTSGCTDGVRGGDETDADCGGAVCPACGVGSRCGADTDCAGSLRCSGGVCTACGECEPGTMESGGCGMCGSRSRTCNASCVWNSWSVCSGEGTCAPGATDTQACGNCGSQTRTCNDACAWGGFGACSGEGVCAPGATDTQACGNCGTQSRGCNSSCTWDGFGACSGEGVCSPGSTTSSGCPGPCMEMSCNSSCAWDNVCDGCSSACTSSYSECGVSCTTAGYYPRTTFCSTSCGGSCFSSPDNRVRCERSCGSSFTSCGTVCPAGYYAASLACSTNCTASSSCISQPDNQALCRRVTGSSFTACGTTCPAGYYVASLACSTSCTASSSCISQPDNQALCRQVSGSSFNVCGSSCPAGYRISSSFCTTSCTSASSCISRPDNAVRCTRI